MNFIHRWYCRSDGWAKVVEARIIPWTLEDVPLGDDALEIGPGPGLTTNVLRNVTPKLTCIEIDARLAASLGSRMKGSNVEVVQGDATQMSFPNSSFTGATCFTMLLKPEGWFAGTDSRTSLRWRLYHIFDTCVAVEPETFGERLERAGFVGVTVDSNPWAFRFRARKP
jgi:SAM-dependent methyltransferase